MSKLNSENSTFVCLRCREKRNYNRIAKTGDGGAICMSCSHGNPVESLTEEQIERYLELDLQLNKYVSFGKTFSEEAGEYIEYLALWGSRVTDPRIISMIREKHKMLFPEQYPHDFE